MADTYSQPSGHPTDRLIGTAPTIVALCAQIRQLASFDAVGSPHAPTILLRGETGTGKGLVARVLHDSGPRVGGPFIEVNCAAIPETMLEAELFGFEAGAFTDAKRAKPGLFEAASRGTLFLDEIDALPLALQGKLLTALESKRVRRLGAVAERAVDVKFIAATNADLVQHVAAGRFRADLYHRLAVVVLALPPLRERGDDIGTLAKAFLQHFTAAHKISPKRLSAEAEAWLSSYAWPGNIRELSHVMERVSLLHVGVEVDATTLRQLCTPPTGEPRTHVAPLAQESAYEGTLPAEAEQIRQALAQTGGNVARAARLLGVSRDTVRYRMQRFGIARPQARPPSTAAPLPAPTVDIPGSPAMGEDREGTASAEPAAAPTPQRTQRQRRESHAGTAGQPSPQPDAAIEPSIAAPAPTWEQKPVVVLALELTWPDAPGLQTWSYDPWTEQARWEQAIVDKVRGFGGVLLQRTPGLLTWLFGVPETLEQLPQRAVHSALAIRQMVADASGPSLAPHPEVRMAVHLGAVRLDRQTADPTARLLPVGDTLAIPVRLLGQAAALEILITPEVGRLVDGWVALEARPMHLRPGDPTPVEGYAVMGVRAGREAWTERRPLSRSPFVGRERELALLDGVLAQVKAGRGQVVTLMGAPGMGKSRLLHEFRQRITGQHIRFTAGQCLAYGSGVPYLPVLDLLRGHCGIAAGDSSEVLTTKLRLALERCGKDLAAESPLLELPLLLDLLGVPVESDRLTGLDADGRRARTFETLWQLFFPSGQEEPLVLAVDDLQWIDPTSEAFLTWLIERLAGVPLLVLTTARPGYSAPWGDRSYVMQLTLSPLDPDASRQVVQRVLAGRILTPTLEQQLLAKADGNPFFLEELAHTVWEQEGQSALAVPDTIHAVLAARMDRLPTCERELLQAASVLGKDIPGPLLQAITALPEETLSRRLAHLQAAEFLSAAGGLPTGNYTFRHILIQETAYQALLTSTRRQYHQQTAQALAAHFPALAAAQPALLAHHYTAAGCHEHAVRYWERAGQHASDRSGHQEAVRHLTTGIELLQTLPKTLEHTQQALSLHIALGAALQVTKGLGAPEVEQAYSQAHALYQQVGETPQLAPVLFGLWRVYLVRPQLHTAREIGDTLLRLAQQAHDPALTVIAHYALGSVWFCLGALPAARQHLEEGIARYTPDQRRAPVFRMGGDPGVGCQGHAAVTLWLMGYPTQALARLHEALALAHELSHPYSLSWARCLAAWVSQLRRDVLAVYEQAEACVALSTEQGFPLWAAWGTSLRGWALALQGQGEEGLAQVRQGLAAWQATGAALQAPYVYTMLADVCNHLGHSDEGLQALAEAHILVEQQEERWWEAEVSRLRGVLLLRQTGTPQEEAETWLQRALEVARRQEAKSLELRAAMSLAPLWQQQGKQVEARQLLGEVYGWFTEGFDTADLQEARALLEELGG